MRRVTALFGAFGIAAALLAWYNALAGIADSRYAPQGLSFFFIN